MNVVNIVNVDREGCLLGKVPRYESNLERSFFRILHELQRLQVARLGTAVPPPAAVDVDLTVHPDGQG